MWERDFVKEKAICSLTISSHCQTKIINFAQINTLLHCLAQFLRHFPLNIRSINDARCHKRQQQLRNETENFYITCRCCISSKWTNGQESRLVSMIRESAAFFSLNRTILPTSKAFFSWEPGGVNAREFLKKRIGVKCTECVRIFF